MNSPPSNMACASLMTMNKYASGLLTALVFAAIGAGAWFWWQHNRPAPSSAPAATAAVAPAPSPAASAPALPAVLYPISPEGTEETTSPLPALAGSDTYVSQALVELLGRDKVQRFLNLEGFARRVVATTDNLAREHAPPVLWPVVPTPGRFTTLANGGQAGNPSAAVTPISPDNSLRYTPFVLFVESVDNAAAVRLYARLYPLFQQAYEELGFPGRYFNDRLVAVIDLLLSTPVQSGPLEVALVEVKGPVPSVRPWVRYEFTDPALQKLSAGQKMLLRSGPVNHRRLNAKLQEVRRLITGGALPKR
ncbi:DUF3014 domain-containing protein [Polaromonas sp.]|uniref:DUF3014 domain-containing protein n=1 Tax=Polaromonas sp. TaxID=1869339 RepID=UPI00273177DD|nr:DUF3014 domain-containing protein [Polaromonas sp.]MDP1740858.1 DUF3014 domain-containing protein [Polaromonas sp.]